MPILNKPVNEYTKNLSELERNMGVDLKITPTGDLEISNLNDIKLVSGAQNAAQAVFLKLNIEPGALLYHPEIGTDLQIGSKTKNAFDIKVQIIRSLSLDPRFDSTDAVVKVLGSTVVVDLRVGLANTGIEVPFQFSVPA